MYISYLRFNYYSAKVQKHSQIVNTKSTFITILI